MGVVSGPFDTTVRQNPGRSQRYGTIFFIAGSLIFIVEFTFFRPIAFELIPIASVNESIAWFISL
jgi:hypothetical protein